LINEDRLSIDIDDLIIEIARKHYTTPSRVEWAIRHAIEISWNAYGNHALTGLFHSNSVRPTNSEFLVLMYKWICINNDNLAYKIKDN